MSLSEQASRHGSGWMMHLRKKWLNLLSSCELCVCTHPALCVVIFILWCLQYLRKTHIPVRCQEGEGLPKWLWSHNPIPASHHQRPCSVSSRRGLSLEALFLTWGLAVFSLCDLRQVCCLFGFDYFLYMKLGNTLRLLESHVWKTSVQMNIYIYIFFFSKEIVILTMTQSGYSRFFGFVFFLLFFFKETYVVQVAEDSINFWCVCLYLLNYKHEPPLLHYKVLGIKSEDSWMPGKPSKNWTTSLPKATNK